jgi:hypothetical protein
MRYRLDDALRSRLLFTLVFCLVLLCPCVIPGIANAAWPVSGGGGQVLLGFESHYQNAAGAHTHLGADLAAPAGAGVVAPCAGCVSFVGEVPARDGSGAVMQAVSLRLSDGRTFTMMPLSEIQVEVGEELSEGVSVGTLAAEGDGSVAPSHLHVGLKSGSRYFDPLSILDVEQTASAQEQQQVSMGVSSAVAPAASDSSDTAEEGASTTQQNGDAATLPAPSAQTGVTVVSSGGATLSEETSNVERAPWYGNVGQAFGEAWSDISGLLEAEFGLSSALMPALGIMLLATAAVAIGFFTARRIRHVRGALPQVDDAHPARRRASARQRVMRVPLAGGACSDVRSRL